MSIFGPAGLERNNGTRTDPHSAAGTGTHPGACATDRRVTTRTGAPRQRSAAPTGPGRRPAWHQPRKTAVRNASHTSLVPAPAPAKARHRPPRSTAQHTGHSAGRQRGRSSPHPAAPKSATTAGPALLVSARQPYWRYQVACASTHRRARPGREVRCRFRLEGEVLRAALALYRPRSVLSSEGDVFRPRRARFYSSRTMMYPLIFTG